MPNSMIAEGHFSNARHARTWCTTDVCICVDYSKWLWVNIKHPKTHIIALITIDHHNSRQHSALKWWPGCAPEISGTSEPSGTFSGTWPRSYTRLHRS